MNRFFLAMKILDAIFKKSDPFISLRLWDVHEPTD